MRHCSTPREQKTKRNDDAQKRKFIILLLLYCFLLFAMITITVIVNFHRKAHLHDLPRKRNETRNNYNLQQRQQQRRRRPKTDYIGIYRCGICRRRRPHRCGRDSNINCPPSVISSIRIQLWFVNVTLICAIVKRNRLRFQNCICRHLTLKIELCCLLWQ